MSACNCIAKTESLLTEKGMKLHAGCTAYVIGTDGLKVRYYLPLQREDGRKPTAAQAKGIQITHCPFCGMALTH